MRYEYNCIPDITAASCCTSTYHQQESPSISTTTNTPEPLTNNNLDGSLYLRIAASCCAVAIFICFALTDFEGIDETSLMRGLKNPSARPALKQPSVPDIEHILHVKPRVSIGPRPYYLVSQMDDDDPLKHTLTSCANTLETMQTSDFVIGHRGASLEFPEHTFRSHDAASRMGAGIVECDVTFTMDRALVCRHSQCDLHRTTNVLLVPQLASKCTTPFVPASGKRKARAKCCTTDFTLAEVQSLCGKMDGANTAARTVNEYVRGTPSFRTDLYSADCPRIPSHKEYIALVKSNNGKFTPELKVPLVSMPFEGSYTREQFAQQIVDEYIEAGVPPADVYLQAMDWDDIYYWLNHTEYGKQAFALDNTKEAALYSRGQLVDHFQPLVDKGVNIVAPPIWLLLQLAPNSGVGTDSEIEPSLYANVAKEMGLEIITWTLERSGPLSAGGGWYYQSIGSALRKDSDMLKVLHVLAQEVGIIGIFSDWAATTTFYANCFLIKLR